MGMFNKGAQASTSTSSTAPPEWLNSYLQQAAGQAAQVSQTPYSAYTGNRVAGISPESQNVVQGLYNSQGLGQPYIDQASQAAGRGVLPVTTADIMQGYNPFIDEQVRQLQGDFDYQNQIADQRAKSEAGKYGVATGDRSQILRAQTEESQRRVQDPQIAALRSGAFGQAANLAQGNQQAALQGAGTFGMLGQTAQNLNLQGAQAALSSQDYLRQYQQAVNDWNYQNNYLNPQSFPYQNSAFFTQSLGGLGGLAGSSSQGTQTQPQPSQWSQLLGLGAQAAGAYFGASDERIKSDIQPIGQTFDGLPIYSFKMPGEPDTKIGLMAQDVEQRDPGAVADIGGGIKGVDYERATAPSALTARAEGGGIPPEIYPPLPSDEDWLGERLLYGGGAGAVPHPDPVYGLVPGLGAQARKVLERDEGWGLPPFFTPRADGGGIPPAAQRFSDPEFRAFADMLLEAQRFDRRVSQAEYDAEVAKRAREDRMNFTQGHQLDQLDQFVPPRASGGAVGAPNAPNAPSAASAAPVDPDFARLTANLGQAVSTIKGHTQNAIDPTLGLGRSNYDVGGIVAAPKFQAPSIALNDVKPIALPQPSGGGGSLAKSSLSFANNQGSGDSGLGDLGQTGAAFGKYLGTPSESVPMTAESLAGWWPGTTATDAGGNTVWSGRERGGRVGVQAGGIPDEAALAPSFDAPTIGLSDIQPSSVLPQMAGQQAMASGFAAPDASGVAAPPPSLSGIDPSELNPTGGVGVASSPYTSGSAPAYDTDEGGWVEGKDWYEPGSNPTLGASIAYGGAQAMAGESPYAGINIGRGIGAGLLMHMKQLAAEREYRARERNAQREADRLAAQLGLERDKYGLQERTLEESIRANKAQEALEGAKVARTGLPGQEALDKEFAKEYVDWNAKGGYSDVQKQVRQLKGALAKLKPYSEENPQGGVEVSGPITGAIRGVPLLGDTLASWVTPEGVAVREQIEEVAQRNLRSVLGAQFAEKEGERLISRAFNPLLQEPENVKRVEALLGQIEEAGSAKQAASEYFRQYGTLKGWEGRLPTMGDFEASLDMIDAEEAAQKKANTSGGLPEGGAAAGAASAATDLAISRPENVPPGSAYSPSRQQWKTPDGVLFDANGNPVTP